MSEMRRRRRSMSVAVMAVREMNHISPRQARNLCGLRVVGGIGGCGGPGMVQGRGDGAAAGSFGTWVAGFADLGDGSLQFPLPLLHAGGGVRAGLCVHAA